MSGIKLHMWCPVRCPLLRVPGGAYLHTDLFAQVREALKLHNIDGFIEVEDQSEPAGAVLF